MGNNVSGFILRSQPNTAALNTLPTNLGIALYRHKEKPLWLLDVWECHPRGHEYPMVDPLPFNFQPYRPSVTLPPETLSMLGQFKAIADALLPVNPLTQPNNIVWSAVISAIGEAEMNFYAGDDEELNMAMRWDNGLLQAMRINTGFFLITNTDSSSLMIQRIINLEIEEDSPWECPPEVDQALRIIPGVTVGEPLTVEMNSILHSCALELWPKEAEFAQDMLGVGGGYAPDAWPDYVVEYERACPSPEAMRPELDLQEIIQRTQIEAADILKTNRKLDEQQPLAALGFDGVDAVHLVLRMQEIYWITIPENQLVERARLMKPAAESLNLRCETPDEFLSLQSIAELLLSAASTSDSSQKLGDIVTVYARHTQLWKSRALSAPPQVVNQRDKPQQPPSTLKMFLLDIQTRIVISAWCIGSALLTFLAIDYLKDSLKSSGTNLTGPLTIIELILAVAAFVTTFRLGRKGKLPGARRRR